MTVNTARFAISTKGQDDMVDITAQVAKCVKDSGLSAGIAVVFCSGATGALSTVEFEPGLLKDVPEALAKIAPYGDNYAHHDTWHDDNGSGHVRATLLGPDITVPFEGNELIIGRWQQLVFIECDTSARERELIVSIIGE